MVWVWIGFTVLLACLAWAIGYWLLVLTEGVYLGRGLVIGLYNLTAFEYEKIKEYTTEDETILVVEPILGELRGIKSPKLLDIAAGTGRVPRFLMADGRFDGHIVALEPSIRMLNHGLDQTAPYLDRVGWVQQVAGQLPFPNDSFDAVSCLESLEFFPDMNQALAEIARVLRPGGALFITRRREWEAYAFIGRYHTREQFIVLLERHRFGDAVVFDWQSNYDMAIAVKLDSAPL